MDLYFKIIEKSIIDRTKWIDTRAAIIFTRLGFADKHEYSIKEIEAEIESRLVPRETVRLIVK